MATYTATADANGSFTVPFSSNYTSGQKITVTAAKDGATKNIELFAPSGVTGGGIITWTGTTVNFPRNIGNVTISSQVNAEISSYAFYNASVSYPAFGYFATGLVIEGATSIGDEAFRNWANALTLSLPSTLKTIGNSAFLGWSKATSLTIPSSVTSLLPAAFSQWSAATSLTINANITLIPNSCFQSWSKCEQVFIPASVTTINTSAFTGLAACNQITVASTTPPTLVGTPFSGLKSTCIFKVPSGSVDAYKVAAGWSAYSANIQAI